MKVSELSSKVDELISAATDVKERADRASTVSTTPGGSAPQEDDPMVQELADRIDKAIHVLREGSSKTPAVSTGTPVPPPPSPVSPPSGANTDPTADVSGTRIVPEPNAPFNPSNP